MNTARRLMSENVRPTLHPLTAKDGRTLWVPVWRQSDRALYLRQRIARGA